MTKIDNLGENSWEVEPGELVLLVGDTDKLQLGVFLGKGERRLNFHNNKRGRDRRPTPGLEKSITIELEKTSYRLVVENMGGVNCPSFRLVGERTRSVRGTASIYVGIEDISEYLINRDGYEYFGAKVARMKKPFFR